MTARHCPGCRGYTRGWDSECPGVDLAGPELVVPDVVPPLPLLSRLKVLIGLPVLLGVSAGPLGEPFEVAAPENGMARWLDPESGKDTWT
jgi:hypothetical protein